MNILMKHISNQYSKSQENYFLYRIKKNVSIARVLQKLVEERKIDKNDSTICYVTGNGLKATEVLMEVLSKPETIQADITKISALVR